MDGQLGYRCGCPLSEEWAIALLDDEGRLLGRKQSYPFPRDYKMPDLRNANGIALIVCAEWGDLYRLPSQAETCCRRVGVWKRIDRPKSVNGDPLQPLFCCLNAHWKASRGSRGRIHSGALKPLLEVACTVGQAKEKRGIRSTCSRERPSVSHPQVAETHEGKSYVAQVS